MFLFLEMEKVKEQSFIYLAEGLRDVEFQKFARCFSQSGSF